ncbi:MAG: SUMF1/EgtB/PvdO family nonheme iron enzyme [Anaerolineae bacterium]
MARLAYAMQDAGEHGTAVEAAWAMKQMAQPGVEVDRLVYLCASATLLDSSATAGCAFVHQLVQEYFAALALAGRLRSRRRPATLLVEGLDAAQRLGGDLYSAGRYAARYDSADRSGFCRYHPALAVRCIAESGGERPAETTARAVQQRLVKLVTDTQAPIPQRNAAGVAINYLGDPRRGVGLRLDGLPDIEWVLVPERDPKSGRKEYIYGDGRGSNREVRTEPDFWIARYPITRAQFQTFVDDPKGFRDAQWWRGLDASEENRSAPGDQRFEYWNHPRERVSWWDAMAFCAWLTAKAHDHPDLWPKDARCTPGWEIRLPTEQQWEKAARGRDGRQYPWGGDEYQSGYANINEVNYKVGSHYLQKTSAVGMYPQGASPYGVADLSGNVWEWCLNEYESGKTASGGNATRVLRGGSWNDYPDIAAAPARFHNRPVNRNNGFGFRVVVVGCVPVP